MMSPALCLSGRRIARLGAGLVGLTVAMSMSPANAQAADPKAPAGDARAIAAGSYKRGASGAAVFELSARSLYAYYKADVHGYVLVLQNINRELCRRLRRAVEDHLARSQTEVQRLSLLRVGVHVR